MPIDHHFGAAPPPSTLNALRTTSFRVQVALTFGALVVALATGVSWVLGQMLSDRIRADAGHALDVVARNAARQLADGLEERLALVRSLAESDSLWEGGLGSPLVDRTLAREKSLRADLAWIGVAGLEGRVMTATGGLLTGADIRSRPWFAAGLAAPSVGDVHPAKLLAALLPVARDGEPQRFVDFAAPIRADGRTVGVLAIHGSWDWSRNLIEALLPPDAAARDLRVFIFDRHGALIHAPEGSVSGAGPSGRRLPASAATAAAAVVSWADGRDYLTAAASLPARSAATDLGWQIVARIPADAAFAAARAASREAFGVGCAAAVAAALIAWFVAGSISGPLASIARAADAVERGVVGAHMPRYEGNRELARVSGALAAMTSRLLASNEQLESRVRERTAELETAVRDLDRLARHDALTGLLNRRGFEEQMRQATAAARRRASPLSMVMIDIDHFKQVNDRHGHDVGDQVLVAVGALLHGRLRETDIVGRVGGEEFAALLPDTSLDAAREVAEQLVRRVALASIEGAGRVTISCGVADVRVEEDGFDALKRADLALYRAKSEGRNRVAVRPSASAAALAA